MKLGADSLGLIFSYLTDYDDLVAVRLSCRLFSRLAKDYIDKVAHPLDGITRCYSMPTLESLKSLSSIKHRAGEERAEYHIWVCGGEQSGKTSLVRRLMDDDFDEFDDDGGGIDDLSRYDATVDEHPCTLLIHDCCGSPEDNGTIIVCVDLTEPRTIHLARELISGYINRATMLYKRNIIIAATHRDDEFREAKATTGAREAARHFKTGFIEVSSLDGHGVVPLFEEAVRLTMRITGPRFRLRKGGKH